MSKINTSPQSNGSKNRKKIIITVLVLLFGVVVLPSTALAYTGFMPGLTTMMGTNKPVDLGVKYSIDDFQSLQQKLQLRTSNFDETHGISQAIDAVDSGNKMVIYAENSKMATVTQQELSAFVNMIPWKSTPLTNAQLRFSDDTLEFSGNVKSAYVADLIHAVYSQNNYGNLNPAIKLAQHLYNPAVYLKAKIRATNTSNGPAHGSMVLKVEGLKVNRMDLTNNVAGMKEIKVTIPEGNGAQGLAYSLSSLTASPGALAIYGTLPTAYSVGNGDAGLICENYHGGSLVILGVVNGHMSSATKPCP